MAEENHEPFLVYAQHFGFKNFIILQQEKVLSEFFSRGDVFINLPMGYEKPLIYHMAPLVANFQSSTAIFQMKAL